MGDLASVPDDTDTELIEDVKNNMQPKTAPGQSDVTCGHVTALQRGWHNVILQMWDHHSLSHCSYYIH